MSSGAPALSAPAAGLRRYWRLALLSLVAWSLLAAIPTTSAYIGTGAQGFAMWWAMFRKIGLYYYLWGLAAPLLYRLTDALPWRGRGLVLTVIVHLAVATTMSFALGFVAHQDTWRDWLLGERAAGYHAMSAFTYALVILCCLAIKFYRLSLLHEREASDAQILAARLDSRLNLARVDSLRMQMNPHFLFNALNSVAALIDADRRDRAYEAVEQLGDLLRRALRMSQVEEVSLDDELRFSDACLALERLRFGDRLDVRWDVADATRTLLVPAFVLQPLVENAVKHALGGSTATVTVTITARLDDRALRLAVRDDGQANEAEPATAPSGLGLANLRERLTLRYGAGAAVNAGRRQHGYSAEIAIPRDRLATAASP